jgi:hypothetical protein
MSVGQSKRPNNYTGPTVATDMRRFGHPAFYTACDLDDHGRMLRSISPTPVDRVNARRTTVILAQGT